MSDLNQTGTETPDATTFSWHPEYKGQTHDAVRRHLAAEIERDQRQYAVVLENAERHEHQAFEAIRELEKRWSPYDFGWSEVSPDELARRILAFEVARDRAQRMISWDAYRGSAMPGLAIDSESGRLPGAEEREPRAFSPAMIAIAAVVVLILIILVLIQIL